MNSRGIGTPKPGERITIPSSPRGRAFHEAGKVRLELSPQVVACLVHGAHLFTGILYAFTPIHLIDERILGRMHFARISLSYLERVY